LDNDDVILNRALEYGQSKPPNVKLKGGPPSTETTVKLFKLCSEQEFSLRIMVDTLEREAEAERTGIRPNADEQLLMTIHGGPGVGKSEVFAAFLWHAIQHNLHELVAVISYTWKAGMLVGQPPFIPGYSSTTFMGTGRDNKAGKEISDMAQSFLHPRLRILLWDENSFTGQSHFHCSDHNAKKIRMKYDPSFEGKKNEDLPFGGLNVVTCQDFQQHQPIGSGDPLFKGAAAPPTEEINRLARSTSKPKSKVVSCMTGRDIWLKFKTVCILVEQHRFSSETEDGRKLYEVIQKILSYDKILTREEVADICDLLNTRVVSDEEWEIMSKDNPKVSH